MNWARQDSVCNETSGIVQNMQRSFSKTCTCRVGTETCNMKKMKWEARRYIS